MRFNDSQISSTGAFLVGELERLDNLLYEPLHDFTWSRDIDVREDVTIADEVSSFIFSSYAGGFGGTSIGQKSWIAGRDTTPSRVAVSATKVSTPLTLWGSEVVYSIFELEKAMQVGRPIDVQKLDALHIKHQLDTDTQVYVGDKETHATGLLNNASVTVNNAESAWSKTLTPAQVLAFFNSFIEKAWTATGYVRMPNRILVPPQIFADIAGMQLPNTSSSVLKFLLDNNIAKLQGIDLEIRPVKWLANTEYFTVPRMVAYTKARDVVRFPMVPLQSMPVQFRDYSHIVPYYGALGQVEFVRPEMVSYLDFESEQSGA